MSKLFKYEDIFLIPNLITYLRFLLIAPLIITFYFDMKGYFYVILFISLLSDFLDGIVARKLNQRSELGKALDPIADGITLFAFIILLNRRGDIDDWFCIFYFVRQIIILIFSLIYLPKIEKIYGSNIVGKTGVCFLGLALSIYALDLRQFFYLTENLIIISAILLFLSLLDYLRFFLALGSKK